MLLGLALGLVGCGAPQPDPIVENLPAVPVVADDSRRVLVVVNDSSPESVEVAGYYIAKRKIPRENVLRVKCSTQDNMPYDEFEKALRKPIKDAIYDSKNPIDFVLLTKGIPIRLHSNGGYSVDGHIAAMDLKIEPIDKPETVQVRRSLNPYFNKNDSFSRAKYDFVLVTRLDGYTVADCKRLVDNSLAAKPEKGPFFFDEAGNRNGGGYADMQQTLSRAGAILKTKKFDAEVETTNTFVAPPNKLAGYASWGSNDGAFNADTYKKLFFKPGALAETFVSTSGRTFRPTTGGQSLVADLIANGVTGVKGYVSEPYTFALAKPDILFDRYTSGFTLAESFYAASLVIKWKDVVIGDPICRPYASK